MNQVQLYQQLPVPFQNLACSFYGWRERRIRMGRHFWNRYRWLLNSEGATRTQIAAYQDEQVARLVHHVYETVPYYRRLMQERGLRPSDVTSVADLEKLPILHKEQVVQNQGDLISRRYRHRRLRVGSTSGTTGTPLRFFTTHEAVAFQWAVWWRHRARFEIKPFTWHLNFTGRPVVPASQKSAPFWRWNVPMRQALISMQQITPDRVSALADFINSHHFEFFVGYPSFIHSFTTLLEEQQIELSMYPRVVFLGAENIHEFQRATIERMLRTRITDQYGFAEGCGNASRCEYGNYHEDWEFGVLECVDGESLPDGSVRGRIVATGFANYAFPFIRYQVGDWAVWAPRDYKCPCGRQSRVIFRIEGRDEDYVITPEGARIMRFDYLFKDTHEIKEAQVVQREPDSIIIRVVPKRSLTRFHNIENEIREKVRDWISPTLRVYFEYVDAIPRSSSGKFRAVISELSRDLRDVE